MPEQRTDGGLSAVDAAAQLAERFGAEDEEAGAPESGDEGPEEQDSTSEATASDDETSEAPEASEEDDEASAEDDEGADDDDEAASDSDADTDESDSEGFRTLAELAEALEMSPEDFQTSIQHTFKAAGEEHTVTLAELVAGYQKNADYHKGKARLSEERREFQAASQQRLEQFQTEQHQAAAAVAFAEQLITSELQSDAMKQLRETDPAEWSARREEAQQRLQQLHSVKQQQALRYQQFTQQQQQQLMESEAKILREQYDFDQAKAEKAHSALKALGLSDQEAFGVTDHRLIVGALRLAEAEAELENFRARARKADETVKRVKKEIPRLQKSGKANTPVNAEMAQRRKQKELLRKARKSGSLKDAQAVIAERLR